MNLLSLYPSEVRQMIKQLLIIEGIIALIIFFIFDWHASLSLILGSLCVICGVLLSAPVAYQNKKNNQPSAIVLKALKAEGIKIVIIVVGLWLVFNFYENIVPFAVIVGLGIAAIFSGLAISKLSHE